MGKIENWHLLLSYCRYLEVSSFLPAIYIFTDLGHLTKVAAMPIYGKNPSEIFFFRTSGRIAIKYGM